MYSAVQKSPEAFGTISEVAVELEVPQHVLRFWETRFSHVKPLKRGGGRRYYRPDDVDLLRGIASLLYHDGLTIKGVQKILREQGVRYVMELGRGSLSLLQSPRAIAGIAAVKAYPSDDYPNVHVLETKAEPKADAKSAPRAMPSDYAGLESTHGESGLTDSERMHFEALLDELLALKERLSETRARLPL